MGPGEVICPNIQLDLGLEPLSPTPTAVCFPHTVLSVTLLLINHVNSGQVTPLSLVFSCKIREFVGSAG